MAFLSSDARFLGVDLALLWRDMREPWRNVHQWPLFAWLTPQPAVLLYQADGQQSIWEGEQKTSARIAPQFLAVELPEEYVLRRQLRLPAMAHEDAVAAITLEARSASPFDPSDLVWGYSSPGRSLTSGGAVELVIASRKQVAQYLASTPTSGSATLIKAVPEVWVLSGSGAPAVLSGYGESARQVFCALRRRRGFLLLAGLAIGIGVIAVTPSIQLRTRAMDAATAYEDIATKSASAVRQREQLMASVDALGTLAELTNGRIEPLLVLDKLTQVLPDDTALQNFKLQGNKLFFGGQTGNASALMQLLGEVPGFKDVHAPTAATRFGITGKEVFSVELVLDPDVFGIKTVPMAAPEGLGSAIGPLPSAGASAPAETASATTQQPASVASPANNSQAVGGVRPPVPVPASSTGAGGGVTFGGGATFGGRATFGGTTTPPPSPGTASAPVRQGAQP
jgi:general secretion pathway protein L